MSTYLFPTEIKLGQTFNASFIKNMNYYTKLQKESGLVLPLIKGKIVYNGEKENIFKDIQIQNWQNFLKE